MTSNLIGGFHVSFQCLVLLQLVGTNGVMNIDSRLRLQLYSVPPRAKKMPNTIEVVEWWRKFPRTRYASTLYITVKGLKLPDHVRNAESLEKWTYVCDVHDVCKGCLGTLWDLDKLMCVRVWCVRVCVCVCARMCFPTNCVSSSESHPPHFCMSTDF